MVPLDTVASAADSTAGRPVRDKWALVVGIGTFQNQRIPRLKYAAKDARDFRDYLVREGNFAPDHVRLLLDEQATQRRVVSELGSKFLARLAKPDDLVVLFFSTHGSPAQADIRGKNFIVAHDSDPDDLYTSGIEMDKILDAIKSRIPSDRVLLVLDACHSGGIESGAKGLFRSNFDAEALSQGSGQLVICSSEVDQQSWESKRYQNGVFTRRLLEGLRSKGPYTKLGEAFNYLSGSVSHEVQEDYATKQSPTLKSRWDGNDLIVALPAAAPQAIPPTVSQLLEPDSTVAKPRRQQIVAVGMPAVISPVVPPSGTNKSNLPAAIKSYEQGDYGSAATALRAAIKHGQSGNADAHYYLAASLYQLRKMDEAIKEFGECFRLAPTGRHAGYCLKMLNYYHSKPTATRTTLTPAAPVAVGATSAPAAPSVDKGTQDAINRFKSALPRVTSISRERPTLSDVLTWSDTERANYKSEASGRLERARQHLEDMQNTLKKVESQAHSALPSSRNYGEDESHYQTRLKSAHGAVDELLKPYKDEIQTRNQAVSEETSLYESCASSYRTIYGK